MTNTKFYSDIRSTANPLAHCYGLSVSAATDFIGSLQGVNPDNQITIRRPPARVLISFRASVAGQLTVTVTDGTTPSNYLFNDAGSNFDAEEYVEVAFEVPRNDDSTTIPKFLYISAIEFSAAGVMNMQISEVDGP